jgi:thioredoxin-like negative regulator of GroEL
MADGDGIRTVDAALERTAEEPSQYREALAAMDAGQFEAALSLLTQSLVASPNHVATRVWLGVCMVRLGQPIKAEAMLSSAMALDPADIAARLHLGELLFEVGRIPEALGHYRAILSIDPDHVQARRKVVELTEAIHRRRQ